MTPQKLKEAALVCFAEKGYEGSSLNEIAHMAGIEKSSIYTHFASKEALFIALWEDMLEDYEEYMTREMESVKDQTVEYRLRHLFMRLVDFFAYDMNRTKLALRFTIFPPAHLEKRILSSGYLVDERVDGEIRNLFRLGIANGEIRPGDVEEYMHILISLHCGYHGVLVYYRTDDRPYLEAIWQFYWNGIKA